MRSELGGTSCPICRNGLIKPVFAVGNAGVYGYDCPNCGRYELSRELAMDGIDPAASPKVSHYIRQCDTAPRLLTYDIKGIANKSTPTIREQADNLVIHLAKQFQPGEVATLQSSTSQAVLGSSNEEAGVLVIELLRKQGHFAVVETPEPLSDALDPGKWLAVGRLTAEGYAYYDELMKGHIASNVAFMAMPFGNEILDGIFLNQLKPAVKETGFDLVRLDERPEMGIIDNHMELAIRKSKFVIAELTDKNLGAYWEAGFAEGMSKPVIYMCERSVFKDEKTHFDTNHRQTVVWSKATIADDMDRLKTIIRITFPGEAKLED